MKLLDAHCWGKFLEVEVSIRACFEVGRRLSVDKIL